MNKRFIAGIGTLAAAGAALLAINTSAVEASAATGADAHAPHVVAVSTHSVQIEYSGVTSTTGVEVLIYNKSTKAKVVHTAVTPNHASGEMVDFGTAQEGQLLAYEINFVTGGKATGWSTPGKFFVPVSGAIAGKPGPRGPRGAPGKDGKNGVSLSEVKTLVSADKVISTGGSFTSQLQSAGDVTALPAGVYLFTVNAKVAWKSGTGVFPQFFAYNGTPAADFSNNIANVGGCTLADGNTSMDEYCSGTFQVTLAAGETPTIYAFGYDSDRGAGSYTLENLAVTATQVLAA